jgi:hypothetical protein
MKRQSWASVFSVPYKGSCEFVCVLYHAEAVASQCSTFCEWVGVAVKLCFWWQWHIITQMQKWRTCISHMVWHMMVWQKRHFFIRHSSSVAGSWKGVFTSVSETLKPLYWTECAEGLCDQQVFSVGRKGYCSVWKRKLGPAQWGLQPWRVSQNTVVPMLHEQQVQGLTPADYPRRLYSADGFFKKCATSPHFLSIYFVCLWSSIYTR